MIQFFKRDQHKTSKVNHCLLVFLLGLLTIFPFTLYSQPKYGITTTTTVTPPYPITLDGFVADGGTKLSLQIMPTDINLSQYPVLMKLVISGNGVTIESKSLFVHEPVYLNGNELLTLSGSDLQMFFNPDNLSFNGYSKTQYQRNGRLPEGVYTIGFELYDVLRKVPVSSVKSSVVFLFLNEVPMLTLPANNEMVSAAGTQTINFRWMTRHSPLSATFFSPEYQFEMWEIPEGRPAYEVVKGTRPFHMATTSSPYLTYGIAEPQLQPGKSYAWRVRESDPENRTLFKNEGYTEVYIFTYGYNCPAPELKAEKTGTSNFSVSWKADNNQKEFELRYRDKKKKNAVWYSQNTNLLSGKVENLKSNTVYEVEVCAVCGDQRSEYSNRVEVNTKQITSFKCGQVDSTKFPQNRNPLRKLSSGEVFKAYGFDVEVKEVTGGAGTFKGKGYVLVPLLNFIKIEASFDNVQINEDYELIGGEVKTIYNMNNSLVYVEGEGVKGLSELDDLKKMLLGNDEKNNFDSDSKNTRTVSVDSVKDIKIESNRIVITDVNGKIEEVPKGKIVVIKTSEGSDYVVDAANNAIYSSNNSGQAAKGGTPTGAITSAQEAGKGTPKYGVSFDKHKLSNYGFDFPTDKSPTGNYDQVEITGKPALVPWKALETGKIERLVSKVTGGPADSIHYYQESNNMVMTSPGEDKSQHQIMINGLGSNDNDKLFAWYREFTGDTSKTYNRILAGQLNTVSYDKINVKVVLVPINGSSCPDPNEVKKQLNAIYSPAVVSWDVNTFNLTNVTFKGAVFDNTDNDKLMDYTADMKIARDALKSKAIYNRETYYLFFIDNAKETKSYMPLNKQFGFIVKGNLRIDDYTRTIAHELGHGPFRLRHTFSDENQYYQPEGTTDNLMDYAGADALKLNKYQWDWMHNPEWRIYAGEDEEEGESTINKNVLDKLAGFKNTSNNSYTFLTPTGKIISLPAEGLTYVRIYDDCIHIGNAAEQAFNIPVGTLAEFEWNKIRYSSYASSSNFYGYKNTTVTNEDDYYKDVTSKSVIPSDRKFIFSYPCTDGECSYTDVENNNITLKLKANKVVISPEYEEWPTTDVTYGEPTKMSENIALFNFLPTEATSVLLDEFSINLNNEARKFLYSNVSCGGTSYNNTLFRIINYINNDKTGIYESFSNCNNLLLNPALKECYNKFIPLEIQAACSTCVSEPQAYQLKINPYFEDLKSYAGKAKSVNSQIENWDINKAKELRDFLAKKENICSALDYKNLSLAARKKILGILGSQNYITGSWINDEIKNAEGQIISTLKYAPTDQYSGIVELLKAGNYSLFFNMYKNMSNHGAGAYNFDTFIEELSRIVLNVNDFGQIPDESNIIVYTQEDLPKYEFGLGAVSRYLHYKVLEDKAKINIYTDVYAMYKQYFVPDVLPKTEFEPFESVVIYTKEKYPYADGNIGFEEGSFTLLPAFAYPALIQSKENKMLSQHIKVTAGVTMLCISLGTGLAEVGALAQGSAFAAKYGITPVTCMLNFIDAGALTYSLLANEGTLLNDLSEKYGANSKELQIAKDINNFINIYFMVRAGHAVCGVLKNSAIQIARYTNADILFLEKTQPAFYTKAQKALNTSKEYTQASEALIKEVAVTPYSWLAKYPKVKETMISAGSKLSGKYADKYFAENCVRQLDDNTLAIFQRIPSKLDEYFTNLSSGKTVEEVAGELKGVAKEISVSLAKADVLVTGFTGTLKSTYNNLITVGLMPEVKASSILLKNSNNETVAIIFNGKLTPTKWKWEENAIKEGYKNIVTEEGYIILKKGNDVKFDIGFKEGRKLNANEVNDYMIQAQGRDPGQPYPVGTIVTDKYLKSGKIYIVEYSKQTRPGMFFTKEKITTIKELREKLAVLKSWKDENIDDLILREYEVIADFKVRDGLIGPQTEKTGITYSGGGQQYESLIDWRTIDFRDYLRRTGYEIKLK